MIHEDRFERQLAEWLEDGPFEAPERAIAAAVAHAQAHPRRRHSLRRLARVLTTRVGPTAAPMARGPVRVRAFAVIGVAVLALAVAAVGGLVVLRTGPDQTIIGPPGPTATPIATLPVSVVAASVCHELDPGTTSTVVSATGEITQRREVALGCTFTSADLRLQGYATFSLNADERADGSADTWGSAAIATEGGAWQGYWIGTVDVGGSIDRVEAAYQGTDGYQGLRLGTSQASEGLSGTVAGTIERADAVPPESERVITGSRCSVLKGATPTTEGSVSQDLGASLLCSTQSADPRLASDHELIVANADERADGGAMLWGTATMSNDRGTWQETWEGSVEAGYTTHRMDGISVGEGGYAGLEYHWSQIGTTDLIVRIGNVVAVP